MNIHPKFILKSNFSNKIENQPICRLVQLSHDNSLVELYCFVQFSHYNSLVELYCFGIEPG